MTTKKDTQPQLSADDEAQIQAVLERRQAIAAELHASTSQRQAEEALASAFTLSEPTQMALLKRLTGARDTEAADLLLALHELAPEKTVRKEARRALIQLAGAKIYPSWSSEPEPGAGVLGVENAPRFWKGVVPQIRETGEMQVTLCWEQGFQYDEARMMSFQLDFWREGVKDFFTEVGSKHKIEERMKSLQESTRRLEAEAGTTPAVFVDCTLAEGRRLLNEALAANRWRKTEPHKDFRHHLPLIQQLVLHAQDAGEDRGRAFIARDLEPDMVAANFAGGWSMGDYGLCYDLLTDTNPLREGHTRDEWSELRRAWHDEAHPARFEMYFMNEREQAPKSTLWLPNSAINTRATTAREMELGWSLELVETQLSGTLPEMPMGTAVYKETGRHWFWTVFTLAEENGVWRISRITDEGAAVQSLPQNELQKRIAEHSEHIQQIMSEHQPGEPGGQQFFDELIRRIWQAISLDDALLVRNPQDKAVYEDAYGRAMSVRAVERALVYADALVTRLPDDPDYVMAQQRLGAVQVALGERFESLGLAEQAAHFVTLGEETLRGTLTEDQPLGYLLLAELLISRERYDEAEELLLKARELAEELEVQAQIEFDLASLAMERKHFTDAQRYLEHLAEIAPDYPDLWLTLGIVQGHQHNYPEAEVYFKRAIEENPTDLQAYTQLNALYMEQREFDKARDILAQGIGALPQSAHLRALMSAVYLEKNDRRRALEYLNEAERLNPELEIVQALRSYMKQSS